MDFHPLPASNFYAFVRHPIRVDFVTQHVWFIVTNAATIGAAQTHDRLTPTSFSMAISR
jgi:hypothetical protein